MMFTEPSLESDAGDGRVRHLRRVK
jgi:hypothetical protein